jgi:hypothetical protein
MLAVWVFYPTSLRARSDTFRTLPAIEFEQVRREALLFEQEASLPGVELKVGDDRSNSIQFDCRGVPVLLLMNEQFGLVVMTMAGAHRRAPEVIAYRDQLIRRFERRGVSEGRDTDLPEPAGLEAFVLKHRDGIDISADCSTRP